MIRIGEFRVEKAIESAGPFMPPGDLFADYFDGAADAIEHWAGPVVDRLTGGLQISMHSFILRTPRHTILIDTCKGNDKCRPTRPQGHMLQSGQFLADLARAGVTPEQVDFVMCTHLHWDHVGWNTRLDNGQWVPTFPNARYIMARTEYEYWDRLHASGDPSNHALAFADSVLPLMRADRAILVEDDYEVDHGISLESCPGHTPGTVLIHLRSSGARGVFCGDVLHSPLQLAYPSWSSRACADVQLSERSRRAFLDAHADTDTLVMPAHFMPPSAGRIVRSGEAYRLNWV